MFFYIHPVTAEHVVGVQNFVSVDEDGNERICPFQFKYDLFVFQKVFIKREILFCIPEHSGIFLNFLFIFSPVGIGNDSGRKQCTVIIPRNGHIDFRSRHIR